MLLYVTRGPGFGLARAKEVGAPPAWCPLGIGE